MGVGRVHCCGMEHTTARLELAAAIAAADRAFRISFAEKQVAAARNFLSYVGGPSAEARLVAALDSRASLSSR